MLYVMLYYCNSRYPIKIKTHRLALSPALPSTLISPCNEIASFAEGRITHTIQNYDITHNLIYKSEPTYLRNLTNIKPTDKTRSSDHFYLFHSSPPSLNYVIVYFVIPLLVCGTLPTNNWFFSQLPSSLTSTLSLTPFPFGPSFYRNQFLSSLKTPFFITPFTFNRSAWYVNTSEHLRIHKYPRFYRGYIKRFTDL